MRPSLSVDNDADVTLRDAKSPRDRSLSFAGDATNTNRSHIGFLHLRLNAVLAARYQFWMAAREVRVTVDANASTFRFLVAHVVGRSTEEQVIRPYARGIVAVMADQQTV